MLHSENSLWFHYNQNEKWRGVTRSLKFLFHWFRAIQKQELDFLSLFHVRKTEVTVTNFLKAKDFVFFK